MTEAEITSLTKTEDVTRLIVAYNDIMRALEEIHGGPYNAAHASREYIICRRTSVRLYAHLYTHLQALVINGSGD